MPANVHKPDEVDAYMDRLDHPSRPRCRRSAT
jgi:hypothetical protein